MNNLKAIKLEQDKIGNIHKVTSALRIIAATQSRQFSKRKKDCAPVRNEVSKVLFYLNSAGKLKIENKSNKCLHLVFSSDQKFCKNFLNALHELVYKTKFTDSDVVMVFGSRSYKVVEDLLPDEQIIQYRALSSFDECESLALDIKNMNYPNVKLYAYNSGHHNFETYNIIPFCSDNQLFGNIDAQHTYYMNPNYKVADLLHMYLSNEIYIHMLESGLKERIDRAISMSEASNNAEAEAARLKRIYNMTRQSMITKEIVSVG